MGEKCDIAARRSWSASRLNADEIAGSIQPNRRPHLRTGERHIFLRKQLISDIFGTKSSRPEIRGVYTESYT